MHTRDFQSRRLASLLPRRTILLVAGLLCLGVLLLVTYVQGEYLLLPEVLQSGGHPLYRLAYVATLPIRVFAIFIIPEHNHHWSLSHIVLITIGTPFFYWACWRAWRKWVEGHRPAQITLEEADTPQRLSRRVFLSRTTAGAGFIAAGSSSAYGTLIEPEQLKVRNYALPIKDLPQWAEGLRIMHISDTHYGPFVSLPFLEAMVAQSNALKPDLVFLTGDYVHRTSKAVEPGIAVLAGLRSTYGSVGVLGNHDHWEGADACRAAFSKIDVPLIDNKRLFLTPDKGLRLDPKGQGLCVAGVGDLWEDDILFGEALAGVPEAMPRLVLSHNPDVAEKHMTDAPRVDALFSGHTHGGQVRLPIVGPFAAPSSYGRKYSGGYVEGPACPVIVSRGVGMAGIPIRINVPPELVVITLTAHQA